MEKCLYGLIHLIFILKSMNFQAGQNSSWKYGGLMILQVQMICSHMELLIYRKSLVLQKSNVRCGLHTEIGSSELFRIIWILHRGWTTLTSFRKILIKEKSFSVSLQEKYLFKWKLSERIFPHFKFQSDFIEFSSIAFFPALIYGVLILRANHRIPLHYWTLLFVDQ